MATIKSTSEALKIFEAETATQTQASGKGDYKMGNKSYKKILESVNFLKTNESIKELYYFLESSNIGTQIWAACYLLETYTDESTEVLEKISRGNGIIPFIAKTTLQEWRKGNLNL